MKVTITTIHGESFSGELVKRPSLLVESLVVKLFREDEDSDYDEYVHIRWGDVRGVSEWVSVSEDAPEDEDSTSFVSSPPETEQPE